MRRLTQRDIEIIKDLKEHIETLVKDFGPVWMDWPDNLPSTRKSQNLAQGVEVILGTDHYDSVTCTGHHFAVYVYNEVIGDEDQLETY